MVEEITALYGSII